MEKRIFIAVVISIALLWTWAAVAPKLFPDLVKKPAPQQTARTSPSAVTKAAATTSVNARGAIAAAPARAITMAPVSANAEEQVRIETPDFTAVFSNRGAELVSFQLEHYSITGQTPKQKLPVELVKARDPRRSDFPFAIEAKDARVSEQLNTALYSFAQKVENGVHVLEYRYSADGVSATKTFRIGNDYLFDFAVTVAPAFPYRVMVGPGIRTLAPDERDSQFIITGNGIVETNGKLKIVSRDKTDRISVIDDVQFIGIEDNYFMSVLKPVKAGGGIIRRIEIKSEDPKSPARKELYAGLNAASDGATVGQAFFGPKQTTVLEKYGLDAALQFGFFGFIARFLLEVLIWINKFTKNYGFAIIVLTILIKVVLYPLQHKSIVSMKKMQKAQPKVESIKNKYKKSRTDPEQRQKMNVEMMNLYKQEGINPMGGCLPIVLQLPILWGFYGLLGRAIELRGAPFIWWIHDLSAKDPYYITPILMTVTMFIQQAITPTTVDPAQKRMFMIMPLVFGWIFKEFPSGLVLYWFVQNILTIVQQMIMNRYWKEHPTELNKV
jgi:YidC/Oxa1 family membrane protein insertase